MERFLLNQIPAFPYMSHGWNGAADSPFPLLEALCWSCSTSFFKLWWLDGLFGCFKNLFQTTDSFTNEWKSLRRTILEPSLSCFSCRCAVTLGVKERPNRWNLIVLRIVSYTRHEDQTFLYKVAFCLSIARYCMIQKTSHLLPYSDIIFKFNITNQNTKVFFILFQYF